MSLSVPSSPSCVAWSAIGISRNLTVQLIAGTVSSLIAASTSAVPACATPEPSISMTTSYGSSLSPEAVLFPSEFPPVFDLLSPPQPASIVAVIAKTTDRDTIFFTFFIFFMFFSLSFFIIIIRDLMLYALVIYENIDFEYHQNFIFLFILINLSIFLKIWLSLSLLHKFLFIFSRDFP